MNSADGFIIVALVNAVNKKMSNHEDLSHFDKSQIVMDV